MDTFFYVSTSHGKILYIYIYISAIAVPGVLQGIYAISWHYISWPGVSQGMYAVSWHYVTRPGVSQDMLPLVGIM